MQGTLSAVGYETILDNSALPSIWQQFRERQFPIQHDNAPVNKVASIQDWFGDMRFEELDRLALSLILVPLKIFGIIWNANSKRDHNAQPLSIA